LVISLFRGKRVSKADKPANKNPCAKRASGSLQGLFRSPSVRKIQKFVSRLRELALLERKKNGRRIDENRSHGERIQMQLVELYSFEMRSTEGMKERSGDAE